VIQKNLQDNLAEEILTGRIGDGDTVEVSANESGLLINGSATARAEAA
jgi:ATP-dependent Clp protease ATP-binding subunit ClpB